MKLHYVALLFLLLGVYASCNKPHTNNPSPNPGNPDTTVVPPSKPADIIDVASNVYVVGEQSEDTFAKLKYWNDGKAFTIDSVRSPNVETGVSEPTSIFVAGPDVYIGGHTFNMASPGFEIGKYWKNGVPVVVTDSANKGRINSIFVLNNDVYMAGHQANQLNNTVEYWKNGIAVPLIDAPEGGEAFSIFVSGTDVYVAGYDFVDHHQKQSAVYWKNGNRVVLSNDSIEQAEATSIVVSGNDVYVSGNVYTASRSEAVYWKNGVRTVLSYNSSPGDYANAIGVSGSDVYIAGRSGYTAKYWKNGSQVNLVDGQFEGNALSLCVANGDVYIAGYDYDTPVYWKNGVEHIIKKEPWDETGRAYAIYVRS